MTGMSQKNGRHSHVRIARDAAQLKAQRIPPARRPDPGLRHAHAGAPDAMRACGGPHLAMVNTFEQPTGHFAQQPTGFPPRRCVRHRGIVEGRADFTTPRSWPRASWRRHRGHCSWASRSEGFVPLRRSARQGSDQRRGREGQPGRVHGAAKPRSTSGRPRARPRRRRCVSLQKPQSFEALLADRTAFLTSYQNDATPQLCRPRRTRARRRARTRGSTVSQGCRLGLFKSWPTRTSTSGAPVCRPRFMEKLGEQFEGKPVLRLHLAPPVLGRRDAEGRALKTSFGRDARRAACLPKLRAARHGVRSVRSHRRASHGAPLVATTARWSRPARALRAHRLDTALSLAACRQTAASGM